MTLTPAWKRYQDEACDFFAALGLDAKVNVDVQGVRAVHAIDVYVVFIRFGIQHRWLVECKFWKTAVSKEKVLAFQSILLDIGADKGFLLSESGFQAGAVRAAESTNIILTSLETLRTEAQEELTCIGLDTRLRACDEVKAKMHSSIWRKKCQSGQVQDKVFVSDTPPDVYEVFGNVVVMELSLQAARRGDFPMLLDIDQKGQGRTTNDIAALLSHADAILARAQAYLREHCK